MSVFNRIGFDDPVEPGVICCEHELWAVMRIGFFAFCTADLKYYTYTHQGRREVTAGAVHALEERGLIRRDWWMSGTQSGDLYFLRKNS